MLGASKVPRSKLSICTSVRNRPTLFQSQNNWLAWAGFKSLVKLTLFSKGSFVALLAAPVSALAEGLADSYRLQLPLLRHLPLKAAMLLTPVSR